MYKFKSITLLVLVFLLTFSGCERQEDLIEDLQISREFAPINLRSIIRNQTTVELSWTNVDENVDPLYLVEFSEDEQFSSIFESVTVSSNEVPVQVSLIGETLYYIRVKAISTRGLGDSTYAYVTAQTLTEQLFLPQEPGDIQSNEATLRWQPNNLVTHLLITPGDIVYNISSQEMMEGIATVSGLVGETTYTAQLLYNTAIRGITTFETEVDTSTGTLVTPTDDLFQIIANASPGDSIILESGDYTSQTGTITLDKPITIRGALSYDKPLLKVSFSLITGATDVSLIDLDLTGDVATDLTDMLRYTDVGTYDSLLVSGCNVHDYNRSFIAGNVTSATIQSVTVEDCIVTNVLTSGGDFFDFRNSNVLNVNFNTSTFNNCAPGRDFFRLDDAGDLTQTGLTINILLQNCTIYACSNSSSRRLCYIRFQDNDIISQNNIIAETLSEGYSDQSRTDETITFAFNNYFNADGFFNSLQTRFDNSTTFTTLDPGFVDAANGDFTVTTQSLIDNNVGDPRWLP